MKDSLKNICVSIVLGGVLVLVSDILESGFLQNFLETNLIMLLIALLAINITTLSIIASKLKEISDETGVQFAPTVVEMRFSIIEQVSLIIIGVFSIMLNTSMLLKQSVFYVKIDFLLRAIPSIVLVHAICILWDTAKAIFVILSHEQNKNTV